MRTKDFQIFCLILLIRAFCLHRANGAKILGLFTSISPSHLIGHMSVAKVLADAGHNLTVISTNKPTFSHPSIKHIVIPVTEEQQKDLNSENDELVKAGNNIWAMLFKMVTSLRTRISVQYDALQDEKFTALYENHFDLVILGHNLNDFQLKIAAKFECPVIVNSVLGPIIFTDKFVGNPQHISYVPPLNVHVQLGDSMNFLQRVEAFFNHMLMSTLQVWIDHQMEDYYSKLLPNESLPSLQVMIKNVSLVFCTSHFTEGPIRPNVPALVEIGGIQIEDKTNPLPKDISDFIDTEQSNGFILFTFGSKLYDSNFSPEIFKLIFRVLARLKQRVIWKWNDLDNVPGKSPNILYKKWLPQKDILAHPNIKLFITHAGKGGVNEAQYHGVPMLALPIYGDQRGNAGKVATSGYGILMDLLKMNETEFENGVQEVLQNPKYKENIKRFSELYRDRPLKAKESVVYWTEYVLRHHGAKHMQSPLIHLNFIQRTSLDIIGVILLVFYISFKSIKIIFRIVYRKFKSKKYGATNKKLKTT